MQHHADLEARVARFVDRYAPAVAACLREARARLRAFFPHGYELIFDNYNALVFGLSPGPRAAESFISVAAYPRWVTLFLLHGTALHDPGRLLQGAGKQVRSIRLATAARLNDAEVEALIRQAVEPHRAALAAAPALTSIVMMEVAKQWPRRPGGTMGAAPAGPRIRAKGAR